MLQNTGGTFIDKNTARANEILNVIMAYAGFDFKKKTAIEGSGDVFDALAAGVNMLGEELESSSISLKEKEQLLREIHHRIKNNLQIISSLLNLQSEYIKDASLLALLRESQNRIKSMALVHEMLYATANMSQVMLNDYTVSLINNLKHSYSLPNQKIEFRFDIKKTIRFKIDHIIPLGLIFNEIISNSLKYAFPQQSGIIFIEHQLTANNKNLITIGDNGIGLPKDFDPEKSANLGMQLVFMLAEQLGGKVEMNAEKGTVYKLVF